MINIPINPLLFFPSLNYFVEFYVSYLTRLIINFLIKNIKFMEEEITALKELQKRYAEEFAELVTKTISKIQEMHQEVIKEKQLLSQTHPKLQKQQTSTIIVLNIGGKKFSTALSTLQSVKGSFFDTMFGERWNPVPLEDGSYFIDRDPFVFRHILNFLREGTIDFEHLTPQEQKAIAKDAAYYQLNELASIMTHIPSSSNNNNNNQNIPLRFINAQEVDVINNQQTAIGKSKPNLSFKQRTVEINREIPPTSTETYRYKFKIDKAATWVAIGLYDSAKPDSTYTDLGHGYYALSSNGYRWSSTEKEQNYNPFGFQFTSGEIIEMIYDAGNKTLNFSNSRGANTTLSNVSCPRSLIPVVLLVSGESVSLMDV